MAHVSLQRVSKIYPPDVHAVDQIDLEVADQEFVVLVGPSGCGKTTTLRMIAGLEEVSSGTISIGERVVNNVPPKDRDIAMVFQNYALYPHMTVYKNLSFALKLRKVPKQKIDERVRWAARLLEIEPLLDRRPRQLSGGQRQRVAVGRAIVREPKVFLFDEPLSNLDAKLRVTTRAELKRLQQNLKTTTVYVTHDQEEAMTLGDRVVVMHRGKIQQQGSPLEVYRHPVNQFVAGFVGMPPMNFARGQLQAAEGGWRFCGQGLSIALAGPRFQRLGKDTPPQVVLGVRPEGLRLVSDPAGESDAVPLSGRLQVAEILGPVMDLTVDLGDHLTWVCRTATTEIRRGATVTLQLPAEQLHLFVDQPDGCGENLVSPEPASVHC